MLSLDTFVPSAPEDVQAPTADAGSTFLFVKWQVPGKPNGPITGYVLYQNGKEIYNGGQLSFNVTGLQVCCMFFCNDSFHLSVD